MPKLASDSTVPVSVIDPDLTVSDPPFWLTCNVLLTAVGKSPGTSRKLQSSVTKDSSAFQEPATSGRPPPPPKLVMAKFWDASCHSRVTGWPASVVLQLA